MSMSISTFYLPYDNMWRNQNQHLWVYPTTNPIIYTPLITTGIRQITCLTFLYIKDTFSFSVHALASTVSWNGQWCSCESFKSILRINALHTQGSMHVLPCSLFVFKWNLIGVSLETHCSLPLSPAQCAAVKGKITGYLKQCVTREHPK